MPKSTFDRVKQYRESHGLKAVNIDMDEKSRKLLEMLQDGLGLTKREIISKALEVFAREFIKDQGIGLREIPKNPTRNDVDRACGKRNGQIVWLALENIHRALELSKTEEERSKTLLSLREGIRELKDTNAARQVMQYLDKF